MLEIQKQFKAKLSTQKQQDMSKNISPQLPFMRVITQVEEYIHLGIGPQVTEAKYKNLLNRIKKNTTDYNVVLITNIEISSPSTTTKKYDEQKVIANMIINPKILTSSLVQIFKSIQKITKQETELIAYVNPRDFEKN